MSYKIEIFFHRAVYIPSCVSKRFISWYTRPQLLLLRPTGGLSGVLLHGAALGNKGILAGLRGGASEAALDSGRAQGAQDLALSKHVVLDMCFLSLGRVFVEWRVGGFGGGGFVRRSFENESGVYSGTVANQTIDDSNVARLCKAPSLVL